MCGGTTNATIALLVADFVGEAVHPQVAKKVFVVFQNSNVVIP